MTENDIFTFPEFKKDRKLVTVMLEADNFPTIQIDLNEYEFFRSMTSFKKLSHEDNVIKIIDEETFEDIKYIEENIRIKES